VIVIDTNVLSELMNPQPSDAVARWLDAQPAAELWLTATTVAELRFGVARLPDGRRKHELEAAVDLLVDEVFGGRCLPFDAAAARHYGELVASSERQGHPIGFADGQIAAVCVGHGAALATRNGKDFRGTTLRLVDPWSAEGAPGDGSR